MCNMLWSHSNILIHLAGSPGTFRRTSASDHLPPLLTPGSSSSSSNNINNGEEESTPRFRKSGGSGLVGGSSGGRAQSGQRGDGDINNAAQEGSSDPTSLSKMAADIPPAVQTPWSNIKEDYELREVIGTSSSPTHPSIFQCSSSSKWLVLAGHPH